MKRFRWQIILGLSLFLASLVLYMAHYWVFRDLRHIFLWSMTNLAFLPISVLVVTLIINRLLKTRENFIKLQKLNVVIEAFFSEAGTELLKRFSNLDPQLDELRQQLVVKGNWSKQQFTHVSKRLKKHGFKVQIKNANLGDLRDFLCEKTDFLLRLFENPQLLEHEHFTELLRAIFHLKQELINRKNLRELPDSDYEHLAGDMRRAYRFLVQQWLDYMKYLLASYPYLFSLAMRTNPFDPEASPVVD